MKTSLISAEVRAKLLALFGLLPACLLAADEGAMVNLARGPYVQMTTKTTAILRWRTDYLSPSQLRVGEEPDRLHWTLSDSDLALDHRVVIAGLRPGTRYYYAVGDTFGQLAGGADFYFTTAPAQPKPTRIWAIGDCGTAGAGDFGSWLVRDAYYQYTGSRETDVWLMLGDNAYYSGTDAEYQAAVFDTYTTLLQRTAVWSTLGNHETYSPLPGGHLSYFDIFDFPTDGEAGGVPSGTERYYSFNYANVHFVCLDSELSSRSKSGAMLAWLEADLAANTNEWVIAFWHSPPYTKGSHDSDNPFDNRGNMIEMRTNVNPILERYGVDLVLGGHSHNYERSYLLKGHYGYSWELTANMVLDGTSGRPEEGGAYLKADSGLNAGEGTVYIVAGSSGWATFSTGRHPVMHEALLNRGSLVIDVDGRRMDVRYLRETGAVDDSFAIVKAEQPAPFQLTTLVTRDGMVRARWNSVPGRTYRLLKSTGLSSGPWIPVSGNLVASGMATIWEGETDPNDRQCFYQVEQLP